MAAPSKYPDWALQSETAEDGAVSKVNVPQSIIDSGLEPGEKLHRSHLNDHFNLIGLWVRQVETEITGLSVSPAPSIIDKIYPIGSIWMTDGVQDPGTQLGVGTWQLDKGFVPFGQADGDTNFGTVGATGGGTSHTHSQNFTTGSAGGHEHGVSPSNWGVYQVSGQMRETTGEPGRLITGSAIKEKSESLESLGEAANTLNTGSSGVHTHTVTGAIDSKQNIAPYHVTNIWRRIS